jgi:ribA/ribD-fused uncharacterized protein
MAEASHCFFWLSGSPFSQFHKSTYVLDGIVFSCAEQGMMHSKALLFEDYITADKILQTNSSSPAKMKQLGRQVRGFKHKVWKQHRQEIVFQHNLSKFTQNPHLLQALINTKGRAMVEASPQDSIWGIGLHEIDAQEVPPSQWPGLNLLGKVLVRVRQAILEEAEDEDES